MTSRFVLVQIVVLNLLACTAEPAAESFVGYVEVEWVYVAAPQSGWLVSRPVDKGDLVETGDTLFELEKERQVALVAEAQGRVEQAGAQAQDLATGARQPEIRELQARLDEARAQLEQARLEKQRIARLVAQNLESQSRGDSAEASFDAARARVDAATQSINVARQAGRTAAQQAAEAAVGSATAARAAAQWDLQQRTTRALVSGRVEDVFHYPGEYVTAGAPVLAMRPANALKVRFFVPQAELTNVRLGQSVQVKADGMADGIDATVSYIAAAAEFTPPVIYSVGSRDKLVFMVEARIADDENLHPGLPVDVSWR